MRAIRADNGAQLRLLDLQTVDTKLAQLGHRRQTLPEHGVIAKLQTRRSALASDLIAAETTISDLELEQTKAETDLEPVRERLSRNQVRIANGTVADPKALSSMVDEVSHLKKRISDLEDAELDVMEQLEAAVTDRETLRGRMAQVDNDLVETTAERDRQLAALDGEMGGLRAERAGLAPLIPPDLLTLYDRIGASHGGVGAAELRQRRCTGCQLEINAADLRAFSAAPEDEVLRCEECGRILIRTPQSGL
ncbi:MAG: C4-type zinc ribbon domain-containing protein [Propionibacteriaceae bacterium]|jgi:predicted  nucleic acid-binding Zn-ribbon protein